MRAAALLLLAVGASVIAQPVVAPTPDPVGNPRGQNVGGYNIVNSFETGYRYVTVGGDFGKYRSDVNYTDGIRLLSSFLSVTSREGQGKYFDEIILTTLGLGNDPYENVSLRVAKNKLYRYDFHWRENEYYNPALTISGGLHAMNTLYRMQDQDLTLFPQSNFKFFLGYSRIAQSGTALSTIQLFDSRGDEFPLFSNVRRQRNEYRVGNEVRAFGWRLNWMHAWVDFKEDTPTMLSSSSAGNNPNDSVTLNTLTRSQPYHGTSPYWRAALFHEGKSWYALNGRFTYSAGRRAFVLDELSDGTARFGANTRQVLTYGDANRPAATGNFNISVFPTSKLTITNSTSIYNIRIDGNSYYRTLDNGTLSTELLNFQYLGVRTFANQTEVNFRYHPAVTFFGGYDNFRRRIRSIESTNVPGSPTPDSITGEQTNQLQAGTLGVRLQPFKPVVIVVDAEVGRNSRPLYPTSDRNYQVFGARAQYRYGNLTFSAQTRANYNSNSVTLSTYGSRARNYSGDVSWAPRGWVSLDASYAKLHLDTVGGLAYFANATLVTGQQSYYMSNLHYGNLGVRLNLIKRADVFIGYSHVQDTGGDHKPVMLPAFQAAQTFPLSFQSPLARLSVRLHERLRLNVGYQYYAYHEDLSTLQNYRANTGYTSLLWSF